jgi:hypothetical protein
LELSFVWGFAWIALKFVGKEEEEEEGEEEEEEGRKETKKVDMMLDFL